jgi:uncharacterized membrane protein AbrB (regulator of aidB expression)
MKPARDSWFNPVLSLFLCGAAGPAFARTQIPLPWMVGPLVALAACNFAGAELPAPRAARPLGQIVIGTALGLYLTPLVAREVMSYWPLMLLAAAIALLLGAPGGIAEMCITAKVLQLGVPPVTAIHVARVFVLILATGAIVRAVRKFRSPGQRG